MSKIKLKVDEGRELIVANFIRGMAITEPSLRPIAILSDSPIDPVSASNNVVESTSDLINNLQRINYADLDIDSAEYEGEIKDTQLFLYKLDGESSISFGTKMQNSNNDILCHLLHPTSLYVLLAFSSGVRDTDHNKSITELFVKTYDVPHNYLAFSSNHNEINSFKYTVHDGVITFDISPLSECVEYTIRDLEKIGMVEKLS